MAISKRGDWYYFIHRRNGRQKWVSLRTKNKDEAEIRAAGMLQNLHADRFGLRKTPKDLPWPAFCKRYLACLKGDNRAPDTIARVDVVLRGVNKVMRIDSLSDWSAEGLEEFKQARRSAGIGPNTVNKDVSILKSALKKARVWGYAAPTLEELVSVKWLKREKGHPFFFKREEVDKFLEGQDGFWRTVILLGAYSGMRRGEMLHLRWRDVDFEAGMLHIVVRKDWGPKNRTSREVPMCGILFDHLKAWRLVCGGGEMVLQWDKPRSAFSSGFSRILRKAGFRRGNVHALRHTFASWLAIAGVDLNRIAKAMGHSSIMTTQIYTHLLPSDLKAAIEKLSPPARKC